MHTGTALLKVTASRIAALLALVVLVGLLPWLSGRGAEYTLSLIHIWTLPTN